MAKKLLMLNVRGQRFMWGFEVYADPQYIIEWHADGLDIVVVENVIPGWVANLGLARAWCFLQDLWNFKNPWRRQ